MHAFLENSCLPCQAIGAQGDLVRIRIRPGAQRIDLGNWGGDWAIWGGGRWVVSPKAAVNVQISYDDFEDFAAVANVDYELVPGFTITPEIVYVDNFSDEFEDADFFGGFLRFQRNF